MERLNWLDCYKIATELTEGISYCIEHGTAPAKEDLIQIKRIKKYLEDIYEEENASR